MACISSGGGQRGMDPKDSWVNIPLSDWLKIATTPNADKDAEKLEHSYVAGGNVKWYSHSGKQFGIFLQS